MSNKRRVRSSDPRALKGSIAGPGGPHDRGAVFLETTKAIILEGCTVSTLDSEDGSPAAVAMMLNGRINRTQDKASVLFLFGTDGVAAIVTELMALLGRASGVDHTAILEDIFERMSKLREEGNIT